MYTEFYTALIQDENGDVSDRELSAIINNSNQLRELVEGLPDLVGSELNEEALVELNTLLSDTTKQLVDLNTLAAHALGDMIIGDVDSSHILDELCFNEDWLMQEEAEGVSLRYSRAWRFGSSAFWSGATSRWSRKRAIWSQLSQKTCSV